MKRILLLACITFISQSLLFSQNSLKFEVKFSPETTYSTTTKTGMTSTMFIEGNEEIKQQLAASGMSLPIKVEGQQEMGAFTETGKMSANGEFIVKTTYKDVISKQTINGQSQPTPPSPLKDMISFAHVSKTGQLNFDSLSGVELTPQFEALIKQVTETLTNRIEFPKESLKEGESFEQKVPMTIPMPGVAQLNMVIVTEMTLKKILKDKALFDIVQKITLNTDDSQADISVTGGGKGNAVYDIKNSFVTGFETDLTMNMSITMEQMTLTGEIKGTNFVSVKISE